LELQRVLEVRRLRQIGRTRQRDCAKKFAVDYFVQQVIDLIKHQPCSLHGIILVFAAQKCAHMCIHISELLVPEGEALLNRRTGDSQLFKLRVVDGDDIQRFFDRPVDAALCIKPLVDLEQCFLPFNHQTLPKVETIVCHGQLQKALLLLKVKLDSPEVFHPPFLLLGKFVLDVVYVADAQTLEPTLLDLFDLLLLDDGIRRCHEVRQAVGLLLG